MASPTRSALMLLRILLVSAAISAQAQGTVTLRGVAWDSVAVRPLAGAFITLGASRSTTADASGRFSFDSVTPGVHRLDMVHAVLDSMGLPGVARQVRVTDGAERVAISIPSFAILWRAVCGDRPAPAESAFVYGTVRSSSGGAELAGARVELQWSDFGLDGTRKITGKRFLVEIDADARGEYAVCGVPRDAGLRVQAKFDVVASGLIDLGPTMLRVIRRDLLVGPVDTIAGGPRGTIAGIVTDSAGRPFPGATIVLDDVQLMRTEADGRFRLPNVLPGTRQIEIIAIGVRPQLHIVDVLAGGEVNVSATMQRVTTLDVVRITGSRWQQRVVRDIEDRRRQGLGKFVDSLRLARLATLTSAFGSFPSLDVRSAKGGGVTLMFPDGRGGKCNAIIYIDGFKSNQLMLSTLLPQDIAVIESYNRGSLIPMEFTSLSHRCGVIAIWTKRVMP